MTVQFGVGNYGRNNPGASPYPTSVDFQLFGPDLDPTKMALVPGSSQSYFSGYGVSGRLESMDGTTFLPLMDANATRLGLAAGSLLVGEGTFGGGEFAVIGASRALSLAQSQAIFGADASACIRLTNTGADLTIGLGAGYDIRDAISEPGIAGMGKVQTAGITRSVEITQAPEPGTWVLMIAGLFGMISLRSETIKIRSAVVKSSPERLEPKTGS
ncbi:MAG: PEP-CTERM sorting domain-containing protein [Acidobacteriota bacterium]|nr:PEP-CTERM sorting domain-containing protein [Acidobacteriota bacterium]